jgi:CheY-like chemotaxis protein
MRNACKLWSVALASRFEKARFILVVDDHRDSCDAMSALLSAGGYHCCRAYGGAAAIRMARAYRPDVILLDISMPGVDGFAVSRSLRTDFAGAQPFIIATTAFDEAMIRKQAEAGQFDAYCNKPFDADSFARLLRQIAPATTTVAGRQ